jgi:hypothetical protein
MRHATALLGSLGAAGLLLAGCGARTEVSQSGNAPAQYSHVYVTTQEVWFNTSATAGPDDTGWQKFPLTTPATVDLVGDEDGTLGTIATNVNLVAGTYSQIRLIPLDSSAALAVSATAIGATYNAEADYVDPASGTTVQLPLELLNPDKGIGIQASLKVPIGNVGSTGIGGTSTSTSSTGGGIGIGDATSSTGTTDASTGVAATTGTTTSSTGTTTTTTIASFTVNIDGNRDLVPFLYAPTGTSGINGIMLSSHATAFDLSQVTGIQGTLTLTNLTGYTAVSGLPDIQATAESLSADGTRHEVVLSVPVHSDGTFLLYPLPTSSSTAVYYDVVIHGSGIATIIIKNVEVGLPSTSNSSSFGSSTTDTTNTTADTTSTSGTTSLSAATINSTNTSIDTATITPPSLNTVSLGTLLPRYASTYTANITASGPLPAGTDVAFYETLSGSGEVPYVIESSPIDPFNQNLFSAQTLSACTVDSGTYLASGETINVISAAPLQGMGGYTVAGTAPNYADGAFSSKILPGTGSTCVTAAAGAAPPTTTTTTATAVPVSVAVPALTLASGAATGSVVAVVTANSKYNAGQLLISHEGALVAQVPLTAALLASGGNVSATVPAGTPSSLYYVSVRVWNTSNPAPNPAPPGTGLTAGTLSRQWFDTPADLRSTTSVSIPISIN